MTFIEHIPIWIAKTMTQNDINISPISQIAGLSSYFKMYEKLISIVSIFILYDQPKFNFLLFTGCPAAIG